MVYTFFNFQYNFLLNYFWQIFLTTSARIHWDYPSEVEFCKNIEKWLRYTISALTEISLSDISKKRAHMTPIRADINKLRFNDSM